MKTNALFLFGLMAVIATLTPCRCHGEKASPLEPKSAPPDSAPPASITVKAGKAQICVDRRLELLEVVQFLAHDPIIRKNSLDAESAAYSRDLQRHFGKFQAAPVVALYQKLKGSGFAFGRVPELTVRLDADLHLRELEKNRQRDFIYTEAIYQRLADYEQHRDKYPTFDLFYPQIVQVFGELAR